MADSPGKNSCSKCGKSIIVTGSGTMHVGGGQFEQHCRNCDWRGGQVGGYVNCPRCGDQTSLVNDHAAQ